tara:strand:- start:2686 stop:3825 length:1140 start_codon:yes stop_codon:yes gene_type:complete
MAITIGNGNINVNTDFKAITDIKGKLAKTGIQFDGSNVRISAREMFMKKVTNRMPKGHIAGLMPKSKNTASMVYPADIDDEHYMKIDAFTRSKQTINEPNGKKIIGTSIVLPIPGNLQVSFQADYENKSMGLIGGAAAGRLGAGLQGAQAISDVSGRLKEKFSSLGTDDQSLTQIGTAGAVTGATLLGAKAGGLLAGAIVGAGGLGALGSGVLLEQGLAINPHLAVVFRGINFREHQFTYKFVARDQSESDTIKQIIKTFQFHMLPSNDVGGSGKTVGLAFKYPDEFEISFSEKVRSNLYEIGTSVLKNMQVTYNGENLPIFFENTHAPVSIQIALQFQEVKLLTRDGFSEYGNDYGAEAQKLGGTGARMSSGRVVGGL